MPECLAWPKTSTLNVNDGVVPPIVATARQNALLRRNRMTCRWLPAVTWLKVAPGMSV